MNARIILVPTVLLGALLACGGGSSPAPSGPTAATKLVYTDPATGTYQLKQNTALSNGPHLVLELWGPSGATGSGVTVAFTLGGTAAAWHNVNAADAPGTFVAKGTVFDLGAGIPIIRATANGGTLIATVAEKGVASPKPLNKPMLQVAVDLQPGAAPGAVATLTPDPKKCMVLLPDGTMSTIAITASTITAQ